MLLLTKAGEPNPKTLDTVDEVIILGIIVLFGIIEEYYYSLETKHLINIIIKLYRLTKKRYYINISFVLVTS